MLLYKFIDEGKLMIHWKSDLIIVGIIFVIFMMGYIAGYIDRWINKK